MNKYSALVVMLFSSFFSLSAVEEWYTETLIDGWRQTFRMDEKLYENKTGQQHLVIFNNKIFGKVLALDGIIQVTEGDEFVYHEMLAHVPLLSHGNVKKVLVIGGGDGGMLREVLRHQTVEKVALVEIDQAVIDFSEKYLPALSQGAFRDPRVQIVIQDGCQFVKTSQELFDVIICDSTDPVGPGKALFTSEFYSDCHKKLLPGGIFVMHHSVPFVQRQEFIEGYNHLKPHFKDTTYYVGTVPTYIGGFMAFGWGTDTPEYRQIPLEELEKRFKRLSGKMKYYTPALHKASFALPQFIQDALNQAQ